MRSVKRRVSIPIGCLAALLVARVAIAQERALTLIQPTATEHRIALVIGNEAYPGNPLRNPVNDARAVGAALQHDGFDVDVVVNVGFREMARAVDRFVQKIQRGDVALLYYSGHGIQIEGENFLLPVDFEAKDEADAKYVSYSASRLHDRMNGAGARLKILVLDACRDNPYRVSRSMSSGLAQMAAGQGSFIGLATGPGSTADDNPNGKNGLFTTELLDALNQPGLNLEQVFYAVRQKVYRLSGGRQTPWSNSSVIGDFYFRPAVAANNAAGSLPSNAAPEDLARKEELLFWESIKDGRNPRWFQEYLTRYGDNGRFSMLAREKVQEYSAAAPSGGLGGVAPPPSIPPNIGRSELGWARTTPAPADQKNLILSMTKTADRVAQGTRDANTLPAIWHNDFLKAQGGKVYVPFTLVIDPGRQSLSPLAVYWRVVAAGASGKPAYEDVTFVAPPSETQPFRVARSFTVPAGDYDVYVIGQELGDSGRRRLLEMAQRVAVPDYWSGEFTTSSVIVASRIDALSSPLTPQQQADRPYALSGMEIVPTWTTTFAKSQELSTFMLIYNPRADGSGKPNVLVEYNFYSVGAQGQKFFNKTAPQTLDAQTLPPQFSFAAGHQLQSGQAVPLRTFPAGEYRLEITVTDQIAHAQVTRNIRFMVEP